MGTKCKKCGKDACFGKIGTKTPLFCKKDKEPDMVDVKHKKCQKCGTRPSFGKIGTQDALFCFDHKEPDMVDVSHETCQKCNKRPNFGKIGTKEAIFCEEHKEYDMIDIKNKKCKNCDKQPHFGKIGTKEALFCVDHKEPDMVDVIGRRCKHCDKQPTFGKIGTKEALFCVDHKEPNMIDIKGKICQECDSHAFYGLIGEHSDRCAEHKLENYILYPRKRCSVKNCQDFAICGIKNQRIHCETHKEEKEVNMFDGLHCVFCGLDGNVLNKDNLCKTCINWKKDNRLFKQTQVQQWLDVNNYKYISTDKIIERGLCGKERPDFLFETPDHFVIIEVDEHQHEGKNYEGCEKPRMINISQSLGMPTVFIRFNPDAYKIDGKNKNPKIMTRTKDLEKWLKYYLNVSLFEKDKTELGFLSCMYLYYDSYTTGDHKIITQFD